MEQALSHSMLLIAPGGQEEILYPFTPFLRSLMVVGNYYHYEFKRISARAILDPMAIEDLVYHVCQNFVCQNLEFLD